MIWGYPYLWKPPYEGTTREVQGIFEFGSTRFPTGTSFGNFDPIQNMNHPKLHRKYCDQRIAVELIIFSPFSSVERRLCSASDPPSFAWCHSGLARWGAEKLEKPWLLHMVILCNTIFLLTSISIHNNRCRCICMYIYICKYVYAYVYVYVYVNVNVNVYVYVYVYVCIYICIYISLQIDE